MSALFDAFAAAPDWLFAVGVGLFVLGLFALIWAGIGRAGNVHLGPDPVMPPSEATTVVMTVTPDLPIAPNYVHLDEFFPMAGYLTAAIDAAAEATTEVIEAITDPLTVELEAIDETTPLFYAIRRPRPYVAESFTEGISRARIERALKAGAEQ